MSQYVPFTSDTAKDWRTSDGARAVLVGDTASGYVLAAFDDQVVVPASEHYPRGRAYKPREVSLSFDADGKHRFSDLQLVYDPLCPDCGEPIAAHEAEDQPNDVYLVITPDGWDLIPPFGNVDDAMAKAEGLAEANPGVQFHVAILQRLATVGTEQITVTTYH